MSGQGYGGPSMPEECNIKPGLMTNQCSPTVSREMSMTEEVSELEAAVHNLVVKVVQIHGAMFAGNDGIRPAGGVEADRPLPALSRQRIGACRERINLMRNALEAVAEQL